MAHILTVNWKIMNFLILLKIVLPNKIALDIDKKLSSKITISLASFATSVPLPIEKPTSAFFKAGASFTPSPVIPTTKPKSWAILTNLLLSWGRARATILKYGRIFLISSSDLVFNSSLVKTKSLLFLINPTSFPIEKAVSLLSPVIITVWIWALFTNLIPSIASFRTSSLINTIPTKVKFKKVLFKS